MSTGPRPTPPEQPPEHPPEPAPDAAPAARPPGWYGIFGPANPEQARRRMRWAWLAALAWWVWNTGLLLVWLVAPAFSATPPDPDAPEIPARIIIYHGAEGFLVGLLGLGLNLRWRLPALLLPAVFGIARIIALTRLEPLDTGRTLLWAAVYLLLLFLFSRGAQAAFTYHWFTHPQPPAAKH